MTDDVQYDHGNCGLCQDVVHVDDENVVNMERATAYELLNSNVPAFMDPEELKASVHYHKHCMYRLGLRWTNGTWVRRRTNWGHRILFWWDRASTLAESEGR